MWSKQFNWWSKWSNWWPNRSNWCFFGLIGVLICCLIGGLICCLIGGIIGCLVSGLIQRWKKAYKVAQAKLHT